MDKSGTLDAGELRKVDLSNREPTQHPHYTTQPTHHCMSDVCAFEEKNIMIIMYL